MSTDRPSFLADLPRASAPADFEQAVLARTVLRKRRAQRRVVAAALIGVLLGIATMTMWMPDGSGAPRPVLRTSLSVDAPLAHTVDLYDLPPAEVFVYTTPVPRPLSPAPRVRRPAARIPVAGY